MRVVSMALRLADGHRVGWDRPPSRLVLSENPGSRRGRHRPAGARRANRVRKVAGLQGPAGLPVGPQSHAVGSASLGIRQSPRGERLTVPTFGPSGMHDRLNCWLKNRR
jgi:hypothetical protein